MAFAAKQMLSGLDEQTERRLVWLMGGRLFLALTSLVIAAGLDGIGRDLSDEARNGIYWTVTFAFFAAVISGTSFGRIRRPARFASSQIAMDVAIVSSLVHFSGGRESVFTFLYVLVILYGALLFESRVALGAAGLSVMAYGLALITANEGWGLGLGAANGRIELLRLVAVWVVQGGALFAVGTLASLLSRELQRTGAALDRSASDLRILRDIHRSTVESIMSGLLTTDSAGCISSFNPEAERITGLQADEVMGLDLESVIPGAVAVLPSFGGRPLEASARTRLSYQNNKGERLYLGLGDSILRAEDGEAQGHVVIFQDVTDVVAMESDLTRSERLAAVGELSAKIAHEIRNPLASISGSIQILASESDVTGESARLMGIVVRETDRLNHLITDFLRYARPAPTVTRPVEVGRLFADLIEMIEPTLPENIELRVDIKPGDWIESDADQLTQMLWNLCLNAVQAMPDGGRLGISVASWPEPSAQEAQASVRKDSMPESADDPAAAMPQAIPAEELAAKEASWLEIEVSDTGCGISDDVLADIFEPFFTTKRGGTGLGLPTVHRIVENHGGELQLDSQLGLGTIFRIRLPGVEVAG
ncbi:MAG: PAS domain S-box protein [Deltaproteobacteria bacterium]|nr:PAS domain S-box protein [Deltaproteobacteria bacterium]